jgi:tetratricopeptide (TPR) repeat protein
MGNPSHKNDVGRETRMKKQSQTWAERGEQSFRGGEFKSAALAFRVALLQAPATHYLMVMFARSLVKVNPHSPFRHYAAKATVLVPSEPDAWLILADGAFGQRELRRAANAARRHMVLAPDDPNGGLSLSRVRFHRGELEQCLSGLTRTEALAPKNKVVRMAQARCLFRLGRHDAALQASNAAYEMGATMREFGFEHCRIARSANRPDISRKWMQRLLEIDHSFADRREILDLTVTIDDLRAKR